MRFQPAVDIDIRGQLQSRAIAALAECQHGVVAARQLLALGLARGAIDRRVQAGELHVWYRGVYAVGHRVLTREGRWMAAVLAAGPGAVLSHRSAAALWEIRRSARPRIEVTAPRRSRHGIQVHQARLAPDEVTVHNGIPVTTPARTLVDLAAVLRPDELEKAINQTEILRLPYPDLSRYRGHRGISALRTRPEPTISRSQLERDFIAFLNAHALPKPLVNTPLNGKEPDFRWPKHRLIVEVDGFATHGTRQAFETDRARDRTLLAAGWRVVRITYRQLHEQPQEVANDLAALL
jgi:very-short-patch-repair endonuclease